MPEYRFDRYRNARKMAEGLVLTKPATVEQAMEAAYLLAGPGDMFVLREDRARLAAVEAERDNARAEAARIETQLQAMLMQHRHDIRDLGQLLQDERCKVAVVKAGYLAAQAGEARAVEALRSVRGACVDVLTYCGPQQQEDIEAIMACVDGAIYAHEFGDGASWLA